MKRGDWEVTAKVWSLTKKTTPLANDKIDQLRKALIIGQGNERSYKFVMEMGFFEPLVKSIHSDYVEIKKFLDNFDNHQ